MTKEQKNQMLGLMELYLDDVIKWWKFEEDPKKKAEYQERVYEIESMINSMKKENLELDEW